MHTKASQKQNKKTAHRLGENMLNWNDKGLITKISKQIMKLSMKKRKKETIQSKISGRFKKYFSKEDIQMAKKHIKSWLTSLIIKEMLKPLCRSQQPVKYS